MKKLYSTPYAELSILCKEDILNTSSIGFLSPEDEGFGKEIDFNDFIK